MAGDWIPMRMDLLDDPAVIAIAASLQMDEYAIAGRLLKLWSWANRHLTNGLAFVPDKSGASVPDKWIDNYVEVSGFTSALMSVGWLRKREEGGLEFTSFDRWNSQGAKIRLGETLRKKAFRAKKNDQNVAETPAKPVPKMSGTKTAECPGPEKRREEKRTEEKTEEPPTPAGWGEVIELVHFNELVKAWNDADLPGAGKIQRTPARVGWFQQRLADDLWRPRWREALARAGKSARLRGLDKSWGGLRIDTFLKDPDWVQRILEGEFDDAPEKPRMSEAERLIAEAIRGAS